MVGCRAYRQSSSGSKVCLRNATTTASSSADRTVDLGSFGPVGTSATEVRPFHLATVFLIDSVALRQRSQARLTMLYRSTHRLCRWGAPMKNLAHSASFKSLDKNAPSKAGTKHLGGEIHSGQVLCPGPGHGQRDRSPSLRLSATAPEGFVAFSHASDDWQTCRDYVKQRLGVSRDSWNCDRPAQPKRPAPAPADDDDDPGKKIAEA